MGSTSSWRPQSPDLSSYAPQSPDLSGFRPQSPDLSQPLPSPRYGTVEHRHSNSKDRFGTVYAADKRPAHDPWASPTSTPAQPQQLRTSQHSMPSTRRVKREADDDDYNPDASSRKSLRHILEQQDTTTQSPARNGSTFDPNTTPFHNGFGDLKPEVASDPTLGVQLKTSFPVSRIKRIMQADEDVGKVAQVTPHVVSRALELFMIKLISASAEQARGPGAGGGKAPKKVLPQHMKNAVKANDKFDFLIEIITKVPDAPSKAKKEATSESEDGAAGAGKKKGKKRKE